MFENGFCVIYAPKRKVDDLTGAEVDLQPRLRSLRALLRSTRPTECGLDPDDPRTACG